MPGVAFERDGVQVGRPETEARTSVPQRFRAVGHGMHVAGGHTGSVRTIEPSRITLRPSTAMVGSVQATSFAEGDALLQRMRQLAAGNGRWKTCVSGVALMSTRVTSAR